MTWKRLWDVTAVLLIYSCTGMTAAFVSGRVSAVLGLQKWSATWWLAWLVLIFPLYNVLLLGFAFLFGRYDAFRGRLSKVRRWAKGLVVRPSPAGAPLAPVDQKELLPPRSVPPS